MNIYITGGTGLIGRKLIEALLSEGHEITVLTRNIMKASRIFGKKVKYQTSTHSFASLDGYDAVINLAGEPLANRQWTKSQKLKLCNSRWTMTRQVSSLIRKSIVPPSVYISGSAVGYYGNQEDNILTEYSGPKESFTHNLCNKWENLALDAQNDKTRVCILRTGIVLAKSGGMLSKLKYVFRLGLGSVLGNGKQYISWVHIDDMVRAIVFLLNDNEARGAFNITAPTPVTNKEFANSFSKALRRPRIFKIPSSILYLAMGELADMLVKGQRVIPHRLQEFGFSFEYPNINEAFQNLFSKKK